MPRKKTGESGLFGDWADVEKILARGDRIPGALDFAIRREAELIRKDIVAGINKQAPGGKAFTPALSPITLLLRRLRQFEGTKTLIGSKGVKNSLRKAIKVHRKGPARYVVGVAREELNERGQSYYDIARVQEFGAIVTIRVTPKMRRWFMMQLRRAGMESARGDSEPGSISSGILVIKIPARPFIQPVIDKVFANPLPAQRRVLEWMAFTVGLK